MQITQHDLAKALDISQTTLQRIESGVSSDLNTLKYMQILLKFPEVALWQLKQTGNQVHKDVSTKLINYFQSKANNMSPIKSFILYAHKEYQSIANKKTIPAHGSFQVAFTINNTSENLAISETLLHKLKSSNPRPSGWPLWVILQNSSDEESRPKHSSDRWQAFIYESNHLDFWMVTEKKCFYHYRALEDDLSGSTTQQAKAAKLNELDFVWQVQNICDGIATALSFAQALKEDENTILSFFFKWTGLKNRFLTSWAHPDQYIDCESKSHVDERTYEVNIPINATRENIVNYTHEIASHLFLTFGGYDRIARDTIAKIVILYLKWK